MTEKELTKNGFYTVTNEFQTIAIVLSREELKSLELLVKVAIPMVEIQSDRLIFEKIKPEFSRFIEISKKIENIISKSLSTND